MACGGCAQRKAEREARMKAKAEKAARLAEVQAAQAQQISVQASVNPGK